MTTHALRRDEAAAMDRLPLEHIAVAATRQLEFLEVLADGGRILVNGVPWREMWDRYNAIISDPILTWDAAADPKSDAGSGVGDPTPPSTAVES